ncbi:unnamed protein product [Peronospora belbahrii]|uniref:Uncharacterized protein n=1 Tax=Peronospora belbahrii TaxID=622444 RepID=A0ABN8CUY3_9STRA|nr:unnamed protein product [Peronospora belbahrii]
MSLKRVTQLQNEVTPKPAFVRYCNVIYVLNVSIWTFNDPVKVLASLFNLERARLIHQGKVLKKGDVWPGSVVQLFGTPKGAVQTITRGNYMAWLRSEWLQQVKHIISCPFSILLDFFQSLFGKVEEQRGQRGYVQSGLEGEVRETWSMQYRRNEIQSRQNVVDSYSDMFFLV